MKHQELKIKQEEKLNEQLKELSKLRKELADKQEKDIKNYGVPLGSSVLEKKIESKKRAVKKTRAKVKELEEALNKKFALPKRDKAVLSAIRKGTFIANTTSSDKGSRFDNRFAGSATSRREARRYRP